MNQFPQPSGPPARSRPIYALLLAAVIAAGLMTRVDSIPLPALIKTYGGDTLWALMVFLGLAFLFPRQSSGRTAAAAWLFSVMIEISQLYHAPWIDGIRATRLGGLVLGFGFLWSDLACYTLGIILGLSAELWRRRSQEQSPKILI